MILGEFDDEGKPVITREPYVSRFFCNSCMYRGSEIRMRIDDTQPILVV